MYIKMVLLVKRACNILDQDMMVRYEDRREILTSRAVWHRNSTLNPDNTMQHYKVTGALARVTERDAITQQPTIT